MLKQWIATFHRNRGFSSSVVTSPFLQTSPFDRCVVARKPPLSWHLKVQLLNFHAACIQLLYASLLTKEDTINTLAIEGGGVAYYILSKKIEKKNVCLWRVKVIKFSYKVWNVKLKTAILFQCSKVRGRDCTRDVDCACQRHSHYTPLICNYNFKCEKESFYDTIARRVPVSYKWKFWCCFANSCAIPN